MIDCWSDHPDDRPKFSEILKRLKRFQKRLSNNLYNEEDKLVINKSSFDSIKIESDENSLFQFKSFHPRKSDVIYEKEGENLFHIKAISIEKLFKELVKKKNLIIQKKMKKNFKN
jgi:hypothetical protein